MRIKFKNILFEVVIIRFNQFFLSLFEKKDITTILKLVFKFEKCDCIFLMIIVLFFLYNSMFKALKQMEICR